MFCVVVCGFWVCVLVCVCLLVGFVGVLVVFCGVFCSLQCWFFGSWEWVYVMRWFWLLWLLGIGDVGFFLAVTKKTLLPKAELKRRHVIFFPRIAHARTSRSYVHFFEFTSHGVNSFALFSSIAKHNHHKITRSVSSPNHRSDRWSRRCGR